MLHSLYLIKLWRMKNIKFTQSTKCKKLDKMDINTHSSLILAKGYHMWRVERNTPFMKISSNIIKKRIY